MAEPHVGVGFVKLLCAPVVAARSERARILRSLFVPSLAVILLAGCWGSTENGEEARVPDDPQAVDALEAAGAHLERDDHDSVIEVNLAGTGADDAVIANVAKLPYLQRLDLTSTKVTNEGLEPLTELEDLRVLNLWNTMINDEALVTIAKIESLTNLRMRKCDGKGDSEEGGDDDGKPKGITDEGLAHLTGMPRLQELDIRYTNITDKGMEHVGELANLKDLKLQGNHVTQDGLKYISDLEHLQRLDLWGESKYNDELFDHIEGLDLVQLEIDETRTTVEGLKHLKDFPHLQILSCHALFLTDEIAEIIGGMEDLRSLNLRDTVIGDPGLEHIAKLRKLEKLNLGECAVGDEGVAKLGDVKSLTNLVLWRTEVGDEGLAALVDLPNLVELNIGELRSLASPPTDEGIAALAKIPKLEQIVLDQLFITPAAVDPFKEVKTLKKLSIKNCPLDQSYVDELRKELPNVEILF